MSGCDSRRSTDFGTIQTEVEFKGVDRISFNGGERKLISSVDGGSEYSSIQIYRSAIIQLVYLVVDDRVRFEDWAVSLNVEMNSGSERFDGNKASSLSRCSFHYGKHSIDT